MAALLISTTCPTLTHMHHAPMSTSRRAGPRQFLIRRLCDLPLPGIGPAIHGAPLSRQRLPLHSAAAASPRIPPTRIFFLRSKTVLDSGSSAPWALPSRCRCLADVLEECVLRPAPWGHRHRHRHPTSPTLPCRHRRCLPSLRQQAPRFLISVLLPRCSRCAGVAPPAFPRHPRCRSAVSRAQPLCLRFPLRAADPFLPSPRMHSTAWRSFVDVATPPVLTCCRCRPIFLRPAYRTGAAIIFIISVCSATSICFAATQSAAASFPTLPC